MNASSAPADAHTPVSSAPKDVPPPASSVPTDAPPQGSSAPTDAPPSASSVPTDAPPQGSSAPPDAPPSASLAPPDAPPSASSVPPDAPPSASSVATDAPPPSPLDSADAVPPPYFTFACPSHGVFTSPNCKSPPPCCENSLRMSPFNPGLAQMTLPSDNRYEHLALTPSVTKFSSPLLSVLNYSPNNAFKRSARGFWGLKRYIQDDWKNIESNLWTISQRLELWRPNTLLDRKLYTLPWNFGYLRLHDTLEGAVCAIKQSHDAFCIWIGYCSYLFLLHSKTITNDVGRHIPLWEFELTHQPPGAPPGSCPVEDKIISELKQSELNQFSKDFILTPLPRAGVMVDDSCQFLRSVTAFAQHDIPVYFYWGTTQSYHPYAIDDIYRPTRAERVAALQAASQSASKLANVPKLPSNAPRLPSNPKHLPKIRRGRLQCPGEHPWDYLTRRAQEIADLYRCADATERLAIEQRAKVQRTFPRPGFPKGPICFLWEEDNKIMIQKSWSRTDVEKSWSDWKPSHKRFDPVERSWDIFEDPIPPTIVHYSQLLPELPPDKPSVASLWADHMPSYSCTHGGFAPLDSTFDSQTNYIEDFDVSPPSAPVQPIDISIGPSAAFVSSEVPNSIDEEHHAAALNTQIAWQPSRAEQQWAAVGKGTPVDEEEEQIEPSYMFSSDRSLEENLYGRFGFASTFSIQNAVTISNKEWAVTQKYIGHNQSDNTVELEKATSIRKFLNALVTHHNDIQSLRQIQEHDIAYNAIHPLVSDLESGPFEFTVRPISLRGGSVVYSLKSNTQMPGRWILVLENPTTVVQCLRQSFLGSVKNVARYLYSSGIPFSTCINRDCLPSSVDTRPYRPISLGWRAKTHRPTSADYAEYEEMLDTLVHRPYGRAALLRGGIVWRLALLCLGRSEIDVTRGPSVDASLLGKVWTRSDGSRMYDDLITDDEMDVICGVYQIATDLPGQTADISWWPKQTVFLRSGLWAGYWSPHCEHWFQQRLQRIRNGTAKLQSCHEWPDLLKFSRKQTHKVVLGNDLASKSFLEDLTA